MTIKVVYCLTRKAGMTRAEFQDYWLGQHADLVKARADAKSARTRPPLGCDYYPCRIRSLMASLGVT